MEYLFINSCFKSKSACVIPSPPPLEEMTSSIIVIFSPGIKIFCFLFSWLSTYIIEARLAYEFIAATNPDVLAKDKSPSFIKSCFKFKSAWVIPPLEVLQKLLVYKLI